MKIRTIAVTTALTLTELAGLCPNERRSRCYRPTTARYGRCPVMALALDRGPAGAIQSDKTIGECPFTTGNSRRGPRCARQVSRWRPRRP